MALVTIDDVVTRLDPQPPPETHQRIHLLISDAERKIHTAFLKASRDFDTELISVPWLRPEAEDVIREMVAAAVIIGPNAGVRSASSTTGPQSDSIIYADVDSVSFSGVKLTEAQKQQLGLPGEGLPRGSFPPPGRWPEVRNR